LHTQNFKRICSNKILETNFQQKKFAKNIGKKFPNKIFQEKKCHINFWKNFSTNKIFNKKFSESFFQKYILERRSPKKFQKIFEIFFPKKFFKKFWPPTSIYLTKIKLTSPHVNPFNLISTHFTHLSPYLSPKETNP